MESTSLTRLLNRLDSTLSDPASTQQLRRSPYERQKLTTNLETARSLLLTLEKQTSTIRIERDRTAQQADLHRKRQTIKQLTSQLGSIIKSAEPLDQDTSSDDEDDEDLLGANSYAPAHNTDTNMGGLDTGEPQTNRVTPAEASELRARRPPEASDNRTAASTTARENLFAGRQTAAATTTTTTAEGGNPELLMSHNRHEQDALTSSLLGLAQSLKASSQQFSSSLAAEKDVLKNAEKGLDKSATGMEGAEREMGKLRKGWGMQGWWGFGVWGRVRLYAMIGALWVGCFLLVFVGPKLRF